MMVKCSLFERNRFLKTHMRAPIADSRALGGVESFNRRQTGAKQGDKLQAVDARAAHVDHAETRKPVEARKDLVQKIDAALRLAVETRLEVIQRVLSRFRARFNVNEALLVVANQRPAVSSICLDVHALAIRFYLFF